MKPGTLLRTLRHLTPRQVLFQGLHRLRGPARRPAASLREGVVGVCCPLAALSPEGEVEPGHTAVVLLGQRPHDPCRDGWTPAVDPLYTYTLHYHGWLARLDRPQARSLLLHWIEHHREGPGWEPYPTAMRVLHWLGWLSQHEAHLDASARRRIFGSLAAQLYHLRVHLEHHLDGNHVWTDLAALCTAGLTLTGAEHLQAYLPEFAAVVAEQLDPDGVHRERTPTYHCLLAEQLAGVVEVATARAYDPALVAQLSAHLQRMLKVLPAFLHPDGDVALWNDSQRDAPVTPLRLVERVGHTDWALMTQGHADAVHAGFYRRCFGPWTVLWNTGGVGLGHQPGHIHADGLALELSLHGERIVVDAGVGTYSRGFDRNYARSTRAHNTVTVGERDQDQHELWASHRIGGRAQTLDVSVGTNHLAGQVRGFRAPASHHRRLDWDGQRLRCFDRVDPVAPATVRYFFPESCALLLQGNVWHGRTAAGRRFRIVSPPGTAWHCSAAHGWTAIGKPLARRCLAASVPPEGLALDLRADA